MLTKVDVKFPENKYAPCLYLVDQDGKELCRVDFDDTPDEVMCKVAKSLCKAFDITFNGIEKD